MPSFVYFIETANKQQLAVEDLRAAGLSHVLDGEGPNCTRTSGGPGGRAGVLFSMQGATRTPAQFDAAGQTWTEGPDGAYWVGYTTATPPTPADLVRRRPVRGQAVRMLDGNDWTVPVALSVASGCTLPVRLVLGPDKKSWRPETLPQFMGLCALAEDVYALMESDADHPHPAAQYGEGGRIGYKFDWGMNIALAALAVNYKLGPVEVSALGLLGDGELASILHAVIDLDAYKEMVSAEQAKLQASASASTNAGSGASSATTSPPLPT